MNDMDKPRATQTMLIIYCDCVSGFVTLLVLGDHHGDFEVVKTLLWKRNADITARMDMKKERMSA